MKKPLKKRSLGCGHYYVCADCGKPKTMSYVGGRPDVVKHVYCETDREICMDCLEEKNENIEIN